MKRNFNFCLLAGAMAVLSLTACNDDNFETTSQELQTENAKIEQPGEIEKICAYVDQYWSSTAVLTTALHYGLSMTLPTTILPTMPFRIPQERSITDLPSIMMQKRKEEIL